MLSLNLRTILPLVFLASSAMAIPDLPAAPTDANHPGSKIYSHNFKQQKVTCAGRDVNLFVPTQISASEKFPVVVYGHGQALGLSNYQGTLEHLAKKGVIAVFPAYDNGFFDQDWTRMGQDYVSLSACALQQVANVVEMDQVVFAGHSKGAYVASVASGVAFKDSLGLRPRAIVLMEPAGSDAASLPYVDANTSMTVVFSDHDSVVSMDISKTIYGSVKSSHRQFIHFKSYTKSQTSRELLADHFWPLTQGSFFGGGSESAFHYYGEWKWLTAAALDLKAGGKFENPYLYGPQAVDKGVAGFADSVDRNF